MKLWLISSGLSQYDTYNNAVVAASTKRKARETHPNGSGHQHGWVCPEDVNVEYLGEAKPGTKSGVICASFNAG